MTDKQNIIVGLKRITKGAEVINKSQIAEFLGAKKGGARVKRVTEGLRYEKDGKCCLYLVSEVAESYARSRVHQ